MQNFLNYASSPQTKYRKTAVPPPAGGDLGHEAAQTPRCCGCVARADCRPAHVLYMRPGGVVLYTVKKVIGFPDNNKTLPGKELFNDSLPGRVWLVTFRLGTGKPMTFFLPVDDHRGR